MARGVRIRQFEGARLVGADLIEQKLARLSAGMRKEIVEAGLQAGADVIRAGAIQRVTDQPELARAIQSQIVTTQEGRAEALVGVEKGKSRRNFSLVTLGYWREFGTKAHSMKRKGRRRPTGKRVLASATAIFGPAAKAWHPGTRERPFLTAAFVEDGPHAVHAMGQAIWERLRGMAG